MISIIRTLNYRDHLAQSPQFWIILLRFDCIVFFDFESPGENDLFVPLMTRMPPSKECIAQSDRLSFEVNYLARSLGLS